MNTDDPNKPAFPAESTSHFYLGMTLREYAAIKLRVADSGLPWLDAMIEKSRRDEFAASAIQGYNTNPSACASMTSQQMAENARDDADALIAAIKA